MDITLAHETAECCEGQHGEVSRGLVFNIVADSTARTFRNDSLGSLKAEHGTHGHFDPDLLRE